MGNSEVGHLNLGAGRIVYQDLVRINRSIRDGTFFRIPVLLDALAQARKTNHALHFFGLLSDGGVHSHISHLFALLELARKEGVPRIFVHAFLDGRDTPPRVAQTYLAALEGKMKELGLGAIATVQGRYYAMDRDKRWDRLQKAYQALTEGRGVRAESPSMALLASYDQDLTDEFVLPTVIEDGEGKPLGLVESDDVVIHFNFRPDRARELTAAFTAPDFSGFRRALWPRVHYLCMTEYDSSFDLPVIFPPDFVTNTLGEVVSRAGLKQLRIAETEKYAHVTYFFSGGRELSFPGEERILIPSPAVPTYDLKPEMSAFQITDEVLKRIGEETYALVVLNYANLDMVGHTGKMEATVRAAETVDSCVGKVWEACKAHQTLMLITADHGNAEEKIDPITGDILTAHTTNPVPFLLLDPQGRSCVLRAKGLLADVAPTILSLMGLEKPKEMSGVSLIERVLI